MIDYGTFERCRICGNHGWSGQHRCPPAWYVRSEDEDEWTTVHASDGEEAATRYAEQIDSGYGYSDGIVGRRTVLVRQDGESESIAYTVECELVPSYYGYRERKVVAL